MFEEAKAQAASSEEELPEIDFATFVLSLNHSALVHLGDAPNPVTGRPDASPMLARQTIDLLALLQEKTRGNLTAEEERTLDQVLYDLRMRYVEVARTR
ncbi:MAG: DUF1844 domain-containing protein [Polyangiaceae bacterium]|nr:DUF1844 domain-containing protein [Polyangiaceae bacterium]